MSKLKLQKPKVENQEISGKDARFLVHVKQETNEVPTLLVPTIVHNQTEPLLEVFKEESQLEEIKAEPLLDIPTDERQPLNEVMLVPKPEPTHHPELSFFCSLCLRTCTSDQVAEFSAEPSWNCLDVASGRDKLALLLGLELELEQCAICRPCWTLVEMLADFREGCLKAAAWRERFLFGLDDVGDDWMSKENEETLEKLRKAVQQHVERIEMAEVEARDSQESDTDEILEEKSMLKDEQNWMDHDVLYPDSSEGSSKNESPKETQDSVDRLVITTFSCANCQRKFETEAGMKIHLDLCKKSTIKCSSAVQLHKCSICSANFTKSYRLREHRNKHLGIKPYECRKENCSKSFHGNQERLNHERKCKGNDSINPDVEQELPEMKPIDITSEKKLIKVYPCKKCPRKFDTKGGLVNHSKKCKGPVESPERHSCSICNTEFLHYNHLDAHMNRHNDIKPYKCKKENCDKSFYGKLELYRHTENCGKEKPMCPLCGLQVATKGVLSAHLETHSEQPTAECETCGKKFKSKKTLKKHQLVHSNERNYPCSVCGKTLKSAAALRVHQRIHTQEKPFSCVVCGQGFAYKSLLKLHMKKCHAVEEI